MRRRLLAVLTTCLALLGAPAGPCAAPMAHQYGPPVDAELLPGDTYLGTISSPSEYDYIGFGGVAGDLITVTVSAIKGSALRPQVSIGGDDYGLEEKTAKHHSVTLTVKTEWSAHWLISVRGADGTTGGYRLRVRSRMGDFGKHGLVYDAPGESGGTVKLAFAAIAGSRCDLTVRPAKDSAALPGPPVIDYPFSTDFSPWTMAEGDTIVIEDAPVLQYSGFDVHVPNVGEPGALHVKLRIQRPKPAKHTYVEVAS